MTRLIRILLRRVRSFGDRRRAAWASLTGATIGSDVMVGAGSEVSLDGSQPRRGQIVIGDRTRIGRGVLLHPYGGRIETGIDVYLGPYTIIYGHGGVVVGKDTLISMHCQILSSDHTVPEAGTIIRSQPDVLKPTCIGRDVWLGAGVTVLGGVTIGDGCVIGAGAVVTQDLPAFSIAVGNPARVVRQRH